MPLQLKKIIIRKFCLNMTRKEGRTARQVKYSQHSDIKSLAFNLNFSKNRVSLVA